MSQSLLVMAEIKYPVLVRIALAVLLYHWFVTGLCHSSNQERRSNSDNQIVSGTWRPRIWRCVQTFRPKTRRNSCLSIYSHGEHSTKWVWFYDIQISISIVYSPNRAVSPARSLINWKLHHIIFKKKKLRLYSLFHIATIIQTLIEYQRKLWGLAHTLT